MNINVKKDVNFPILAITDGGTQQGSRHGRFTQAAHWTRGKTGPTAGSDVAEGINHFSSRESKPDCPIDQPVAYSPHRLSYRGFQI